MKALLAVVVLLVSSVSFSQDTNWCYSTFQQAPQEQPLGYAVLPIDTFATNKHHYLALEASTEVYNLPDLENSKSASEFVSDFETFQANPLPGYTLWGYEARRLSGLKFAVYEPNDDQEPWIIAFAGSETRIDWLSDLSMGTDQVAEVEDLVRSLLDCFSMARNGDPIAGKNWIVTGHSLGGGIAQLFAFKTQSMKMLKRLTMGRMELITFNAFGSLELALPSPVAADLILPSILSFNYFVTGDPVSKIGKHIGDTFELPMAPPNNLIEAGNRHKLGSVESLVVQNNLIDFNIAQYAAPPYSEPLNALKGVGQTLGFLAENNSSNVNNQLEHLNLLVGTVYLIEDRGVSGPYDREALAYLKKMAQDYKADLESRASTGFKDGIIQDLEKLISRIENI